MANLIIKSSADDLVLQGSDNSPAITVGAPGTTSFAENATFSGTANVYGAGTFPAGMITKYERTLSTGPSPQDSTSSYVDVTGTSVSYTPQTGASKVYYKTKFFAMGDQTDEHPILMFKINHDGSDVNDSRFYLDTRGGDDQNGHFTIGPLSIEYVLPAWTGAKTTKVAFRDYSSGYQGTLHEVYIFDSVGANLAYPIETIMYSIM